MTASLFVCLLVCLRVVLFFRGDGSCEVMNVRLLLRRFSGSDMALRCFGGRHSFDDGEHRHLAAFQADDKMLAHLILVETTLAGIDTIAHRCCVGDGE